ncbi:ABC transporter permease [Marmoricola sp. RAF53]|uniref:ABC transporter permease n=1 Tax=Marmoricola sp. RAF53 TaxID=3233059 RepID=UPI003F94B615
MSTTTYAATLDVSATPHVPMSRLVKVELRKMVDTRAGMWLMITMAAVTVIAVTIFGFAAGDSEQTFLNFMQFAGAPQGFLLPVMGILLVTQEWGQRTAMVTFALEPRRGKVLAAKVYAALLIGLAAFLVAIAVAAVATVVFGPSGALTDVGPMDFVKFGIIQVAGILQGLAFGLLFLNSAAAIVLYFILPTVFSIIANVWSFLADKAAWIDFGTAQGPFFDSGNPTGQEWAQLLVTGTIWVIIPFVLGAWRMLRAELK